MFEPASKKPRKSIADELPPEEAEIIRYMDAADLAAERARTDAALAAFASLADRLDALAAERARPWWRRLRLRAV